MATWLKWMNFLGRYASAHPSGESGCVGASVERPPSPVSALPASIETTRPLTVYEEQIEELEQENDHLQAQVVQLEQTIATQTGDSLLAARIAEMEKDFIRIDGVWRKERSERIALARLCGDQAEVICRIREALKARE